jgi:hypothetical protein
MMAMKAQMRCRKVHRAGTAVVRDEAAGRQKPAVPSLLHCSKSCSWKTKEEVFLLVLQSSKEKLSG